MIYEHTIHKCRLKPHHAKKMACLNMVQNYCCRLWAKAHLKMLQKVWTYSSNTSEYLNTSFLKQENIL